ncbi:DUF2252 family protein [Streptomyces sp. NBC_00659]|uniref:DUF2252 family protein n=1 Tax=Streptomyces sp. NBC_00659 TaxID=2903669 RepID=UPI003FCD2312
MKRRLQNARDQSTVLPREGRHTGTVTEHRARSPPRPHPPTTPAPARRTADGGRRTADGGRRTAWNDDWRAPAPGTLPGPFERDAERLAAGIAVTARENGHKEEQEEHVFGAARAATGQYRKAARRPAPQDEPTVRHQHIDADRRCPRPARDTGARDAGARTRRPPSPGPATTPAPRPSANPPRPPTDTPATPRTGAPQTNRTATRSKSRPIPAPTRFEKQADTGPDPAREAGRCRPRKGPSTDRPGHPAPRGQPVHQQQ